MGKFKKGNSVTKINTNTPIMKVISVRKNKITCQWNVTDEFDLEVLTLQMKAIKIKPSQNINIIEQGDTVTYTDNESTPMLVLKIQNSKAICEFLQTETFDDYLLQYPPSLGIYLL